ncbi:MAG: hypothetical protein H0W72_13795 [Planctomycetes bacterium]|nr:hypothetical protein [Planctomycetota bacterium]
MPVLIWICAACVVGWFAQRHRGRDFATWAFIGLLCPLIAFVVILISEDRRGGAPVALRLSKQRAKSLAKIAKDPLASEAARAAAEEEQRWREGLAP